jgi:hypothetical protein
MISTEMEMRFVELQVLTRKSVPNLALPRALPGRKHVAVNKALNKGFFSVYYVDYVQS